MQMIRDLVVTFLINSLWQISALGLVVLPFRRPMRKAQAKYQHLVWVMALGFAFLLPAHSAFIGTLHTTHMPLRQSPDAAPVTNGTSSLYPLPPSLTQSVHSQREANPATRTAPQAISRFHLPYALRYRGGRIAIPPFVCWLLFGCYLLFILIRSTALARAWREIRKIRESAKTHSIPECISIVVCRCKAEFKLDAVAILCSSRVAGPLTLGAYRPAIILPEAFFERASADDLTATLSHEMAHITRHDYLLNVIYQIFYLPISFHPAARLIKRRIGATRELACDEIVARRTLEPTSYARSLVNIARSLPHLQVKPMEGGDACILGFLEPNILEERVTRLLNEAPRHGTRLGKALLALASAMLIASCLAAATFSLGVAHKISAAPGAARPSPSRPADLRARFVPLRARTRFERTAQKTQVKAGREEPGDNFISEGGPHQGIAGGVVGGVAGGVIDGVVGGVLGEVRGRVSGGISGGINGSIAEGVKGPVQTQATQEQRGSISGTVFDPSGARVPGAIVSLTNESTHRDWGAATDETGDFSFTALSFGKYKLEITKSGFDLYRWNYDLNASSPLSKQNIVLEPGMLVQVVTITAKGPAVESTPKKTAPHRIRVGGLIQASKLIEQPRPEYPAEARARGIQGTVLMRAVISKEGEILSLKVLKSPDPELSKAATDAVAQWRYEPTLLNGEPIEVVSRVAVQFQIEH